MGRSALEDRLEEITRAFVAQIVSALRNASFADVAALEVGSSAPPRPTRPKAARTTSPTRVSASPSSNSSSRAGERERPRQTADRRAELGERVIRALENAEHPLGVRALSSELGVAPDLLAAPLRELRDAGKIAKHGEKRATTYSIA
ncbi:MAG TPA: hypothetical protein VGI39_44295 [Polyangiaceae bacterium]|jgi:hypothetical protein